jgi:hypothetical protein
MNDPEWLADMQGRPATVIPSPYVGRDRVGGR